RHIAAAYAGLYRDALGAVPPGGLPEAFLADVPDALGRLLRRYAAAHGPFTTEQPRARYGLGAAVVESALRELERAGTVVRGELHPDPAALRRPARGGDPSSTSAATTALGDATALPAVSPASRDDGREWCDVEVLRRLRRASLAALRREIEPAERRAYAAFLPSWHGIDRHAAAGAGVDRLREQLVPLQGLALTPRTWEREVLPRRVGAYSPAWMDELCASGELVWVGAGALGRTDGRVALYFREDVALLGPPPRRGEPAPGPNPPGSSAHARVRARLNSGGCFFTDLLVDVELPAPELAEALWDLVWAGEVTNDAFAPLRAPRLKLAPSSRPSAGMPRRGGRFSMMGRPSARRAGAHPPGRWSLTAPLFGDTGSPADRLRALAELLLERHGILTRELVLAEGVPGGFAALYPELCRLETLGVARRGYFVEGLGGAQFALPGAVERLRAQRDDRGPTRAGVRPVMPSSTDVRPLVLAATDPAQPYGAALPWRASPGSRRQDRLAERPAAGGSAEMTGAHSPRRPPRPSPSRTVGARPPRSSSPARVPGASVVLVGGEPVLYLERGGRALRVLLAGPEDSRVQQGLLALAEHARAGRLPVRIALERVDGEPVLGSRWEAALERAGFRVGPRRVELAATLSTR
ncbi:MAG: Lhr family helicase, partial [Solirubrobacteraceae bacterium]